MSMNAPILPDDTGAALDKLNELTCALVEAIENVTNSIALGKDMDFYHSLKQKDHCYALYERGVREFYDRESDFLSLNNERLKKLYELHAVLKTNALINLRFLDGLAHKRIVR